VTVSGVTSTTATLSWTTDQLGDSQADYGTTAGYGSSTLLVSALVSTHSQGLSGLTPGTFYHFRVKSKNGAGLPGASADGTFTTPGSGVPRLPVNLGSAGAFVILSKTGVTNVPTSAIVGDVGASPITGAAILLTCAEVTGRILSVDAAGPLPCRLTDPISLTAAIGDMTIAFDDAAARVTPDFTELGAGEIGGRTLAQGLYKWGSGVSISTSVTLSGGPNDVWIFQIAGTLNQANATQVILSGGAQAKNIFWQVGADVALGTSAHFEGVLLVKTKIALNTGASITGRLFAQTAVTLQQNAVTRPQ
jgi:hypothetical protein